MGRGGRKPVQRRDHGTRACYLRGPGPGTGKGCRCAACVRAHRDWGITRERGLVRGDWTPWTAAEPARAHVCELIAAGLTQENVAALAGVAPGSMTHLMRGSNGNPPARRIRPETARKILAVRASAAAVPPRGMVDSTGTVRRLRALVAIGWPMGWLADELAMKRTNFSVMMRGTQVRASTAAAVRELYRRLWDKRPPEDSPRRAAEIRKARALAAARSWRLPMAWDDDRIDNPAARPAAAGHGGLSAREGRLVDYAELRSWGLTREQAAARMGVSLRTIERYEQDPREAPAESALAS